MFLAAKISPERVEVVQLSLIDYLNAVPLTWALKSGHWKNQLRTQSDFPSVCADLLAAGQVDAGLVSSIEYARIPQTSLVDRVCIASPGAVHSVLLWTRVPFERIQRVAVDRFSRSSVALLRVLFHLKGVPTPPFTAMTPGPDMLRHHEAALVIGDAALAMRKTTLEAPWRLLDCAQLWHEATGLPFVFALWVIRKAPHLDFLGPVLREAKAMGLEALPALIPGLARQHDLTPQALEHYFHHHLHYTLGEEERKSLELFYEIALTLDLIPQKPVFHWV